ncbi:HNH endonuclease [uncultured virus]|nr:HNH endonuclease [uncultured virus]
MNGKEIYKPVNIEKFKDIYVISNFGNLKNKISGKISQSNSLRSGYKSVWLSNNGFSKNYKIHILVAKTFLQKPSLDKNLIINHKNGNKLDNYSGNLEWITKSGNVKHAYENNLIKPFEIKVCQLNLKYELIKIFNSAKKAQDETGIARNRIASVCKGKRQTTGGYKWKYFDEENNKKIEIDLSKFVKIDSYQNYCISKNGEIYSIKYKKILKPQTNADGYLTIQLREKNIKKDYLIHRLVAQTYIKNPLNKKQVNHINENKKDNSVENLEWSTNGENQLHSINLKKSRILIK